MTTPIGLICKPTFALKAAPTSFSTAFLSAPVFCFKEQGHDVFAVHVVDHHLVLTADAFDIAENVLHLSRIDVDTLDFNHVVTSADDTVNSRGTWSHSRTFSGNDSRQIVSSVSDQRRALFAAGS